MLKPAVIGKDGRTAAIIRALEKNTSVGKGGVHVLSDWKEATPQESIKTVLEQAEKVRPDFVVIGPEDPLAQGIVERLQERGFPCIGPTSRLALLESSKAFARDLLSQYNIPGNPEYRVFKSMDGIESYLRPLGGYVVKPDGLTGGKGVKVSDVHLFEIDHALDYCREIFEAKHQSVVIEEKLDGEEFSLMSFCDGFHVRDMVPVQDHKRAHEGDTGPNTGGMGSYSCEDHLLPFLTKSDLQQASDINNAVAEAIFKKTGEKYRGILYGGFMVTKNGLKLLEYNARFGDPETMNVLSILETDLVEIFQAMITETLDKLPIRFSNQATVCKYVVPNGYPDKPVRNQSVIIPAVPDCSNSLQRFDSAIRQEGSEWILTGSRAVAFVGVGKDLTEAEQIAEAAASQVVGPVFHRKDIGTPALISSRVRHIQSLMRQS